MGSRHSKIQLKKQKGAAAIIFASVLLFGIGVTTIYSARVGVIEQKVTSNQIRAKQARQAANSGVSTAMLRIKKSQVLTHPEATLPAETIQGVGEYITSYETVGGDPNRLLVTINANSVDGSGLRDVQQNYKFMPYLRSVPPATMVASGDVTLSDDTVIFDNKSTKTDATIWCGKSLKKRGVNGLGVRATTAKTTSNVTGGGTTARTKANSTRLPTGDALFESFFASTKADVKKIAKVVTCNPKKGCNAKDVDGLSGLVWVDGDLKINGNTKKGVGQFDATNKSPVILIVNGQFKVNHPNALVNGMVYVIGDWNNAGGKGGKVKGSVVVEGNMTASGSLIMKYNDTILSSVQDTVGLYIPIPGTWKEI